MLFNTSATTTNFGIAGATNNNNITYGDTYTIL